MASLPTLVRRLAPGAARTLRSAAGRCRPMASLSAGAALATLAEASPHVDVVRYSHKNVKWTLSKVDAYSEALAVGFVENGLRPGDAVLSWLPAHYGSPSSASVVSPEDSISQVREPWPPVPARRPRS